VALLPRAVKAPIPVTTTLFISGKYNQMMITKFILTFDPERHGRKGFAV
jgi:hypothetical protein